MKRQKITIRHAQIIQEIRDRLNQRLKRREYNHTAGVGVQPIRPRNNPEPIDDVQALLQVIEEVIAL